MLIETVAGLKDVIMSKEKEIAFILEDASMMLSSPGSMM